MGGNEMRSQTRRPAARVARLVGILALVALPALAAEDADQEESGGAKPTIELYGFAMLDMGYQSKQNDPNWFDVLRPTKLPAFKDEFGEDGHWFAGVRQSRLGVKAETPNPPGPTKTI